MTSARLPSITDYCRAMADPFGLFKTLGDVVPVKDLRGNPVFYPGNSGAVFNVRHSESSYALKCFLKNDPQRDARYEYLSHSANSLVPAIHFLKEEFFVYDILSRGCYMDILLYPWTDGETLSTLVKRAAIEGDHERLLRFSADWDSMAARILGMEWAHGDIKPDNIIVDRTGKFSLVDWDAVFIPGLGSDSPAETGTPGFQHPARTPADHNKNIDDYSLALISVSLRALAYDLSLYKKFYRSDILILDPEEILAGCSEGYDTILKLFSWKGSEQEFALAQTLRSPEYRIDGLADLLS